MMSGIIVHINGWPGVGKYTIGRIAAQQLDARFLPNHVICGPGLSVAGFGTPACGKVVRQTRALVFEAIVAAAPSESFVLTTVLFEEDVARFESIMDLAIRRSAPFLCVTLHCAMEENSRRLHSESRIRRHSLTDAKHLRQLRRDNELLQPICDDHIELDTSTVTADENATKIIDAAARIVGRRVERK